MAALCACLAIAFLGVMAYHGEVPETGQLVKFTPKGVLQVPPERIHAVRLQAGERQVALLRVGPHAWRYRDTEGTVSDELRDHLEGAMVFMYASAPVRLMLPEEYHGTGLQEFGLEPPRYSIVLADARQVLLEAHFGAANPQDLLQYMQLQNSDAVYLMSRFVGQMWEHILEHLELLRTETAQ